jgi:DHA2 family multidrug resistance protein
MSWHWLFFINVVPGIIITVGVLALVDFDQPNFALLEHFDWFGLITMAGFLGALEYVLEEGPQYEWLQDTSVAVCAAVCVVSGIAFFYRVLTAREPIVDIRAFNNRNFGVGCLISFCVGIGLYGLTYIYPRYLAEVRGYSALMNRKKRGGEGRGGRKEKGEKRKRGEEGEEGGGEEEKREKGRRVEV